MQAGVDEAGRGPLAGAVIAAAVILKNPDSIKGLKDSKLLTPLKRDKLFLEIQEKALSFAFGRAEVEEIDSLNIHHATLLAMQRALIALPIQPESIIIDGLYKPDCGAIPASTLVGGDNLIPAISAASILAKVARDREMILLDQQYPGYGFAQHKGYGTALHIQALRNLGPSPVHRRSFAPVKNWVNVAV